MKGFVVETRPFFIFIFIVIFGEHLSTYKRCSFKGYMVNIMNRL